MGHALGLQARARRVTTEAVEDYAKTIYALAQREAGPGRRPRRSPSASASRPARSPRCSSGWPSSAWSSTSPTAGVTLTDRRRAGRARGDPPPPADRVLSGRGAGDALGPGPRRGRGARALHLRGPRGADRGEARRSEPRSPRRPDPERRARHGRRRDRPLAELDAGERGRRSSASRTATPRCCATWTSAGSALAASLSVRAPRPVRRPAVRRGRGRGARARAAARRARCGSRVRAHALSCSRRPRRAANAAARGGRHRPGGRGRPAGRGGGRPGRATLARRRDAAGSARLWPFLGPAFIAAVAYIDPGNFATNIAAGAQFGYLLLWVVLAANLMAMLIQTQSAKLGIATGKNLPELCREHFRSRPRAASGSRRSWSRCPPTSPRWSAPPSASTCCSGSRCSRRPDRRRRRLRDPGPPAARLPSARGGDRRRSSASSWSASASRSSGRSPIPARSPGTFRPRVQGTESILLATGIIGATVMPHVVYLHSALTQRRVVGRNARRAQADPAVREDRRGDRDDDRRGGEHLDDGDGGRAVNVGGLTGIDTIEGAFDGLKPPSPTTPRRSSASPCSPAASPRPRSGRWPGRS